MSGGSIGDRVWYDSDIDGQQDAEDEPGLSGVTVTLYRDNGDGTFTSSDPVVATMLTDNNGQYLFTNLPAGRYFVQASEVDPVSGDWLYFSTTANPHGPIELAPGQNYLNADIGLIDFGV